MSSQSQSAVGRRRSNIRQYSVEDQALNMISKEAEARLAAKRAARAEAREIRMKEMEKQHKNSEEKSDKIYELTNEHAAAKMRQQVGGSRRGSSESNDSIGDGKDIDFKEQVRELEDKYKAAMMTSAQLDNEKQSLVYQVELLKDQLEEQDEGYTELQREYKDKCREYELQKRDMKNMEHELSILKQQLELKDRLIQESGFVIMSNDKGEPVLEKQSSSLSAAANENLLPSGDILVSPETKEFLEKAEDGTLGTPIHSNPSTNQSVVSKSVCEISNDTPVLASPDNEPEYVENSKVPMKRSNSNIETANNTQGDTLKVEVNKTLEPHDDIVMASKYSLHESDVVTDLTGHAVVVDACDDSNLKPNNEPSLQSTVGKKLKSSLDSDDADEFFDAVSTPSFSSRGNATERDIGRMNVVNDCKSPVFDFEKVEGSGSVDAVKEDSDKISKDGNTVEGSGSVDADCKEDTENDSCMTLSDATTSESHTEDEAIPGNDKNVVKGSGVEKTELESLNDFDGSMDGQGDCKNCQNTNLNGKESQNDKIERCDQSDNVNSDDVDVVLHSPTDNIIVKEKDSSEICDQHQDEELKTDERTIEASYVDVDNKISKNEMISMGPGNIDVVKDDDNISKNENIDVDFVSNYDGDEKGDRVSKDEYTVVDSGSADCDEEKNKNSNDENAVVFPEVVNVGKDDDKCDIDGKTVLDSGSVDGDEEKDKNNNEDSAVLAGSIDGSKDDDDEIGEDGNTVEYSRSVDKDEEGVEKLSKDDHAVVDSGSVEDDDIRTSKDENRIEALVSIDGDENISKNLDGGKEVSEIIRGDESIIVTSGIGFVVNEGKNDMLSEDVNTLKASASVRGDKEEDDKINNDEKIIDVSGDVNVGKEDHDKISKDKNANESIDKVEDKLEITVVSYGRVEGEEDDGKISEDGNTVVGSGSVDAVKEDSDKISKDGNTVEGSGSVDAVNEDSDKISKDGNTVEGSGSVDAVKEDSDKISKDGNTVEGSGSVDAVKEDSDEISKDRNSVDGSGSVDAVKEDSDKISEDGNTYEGSGSVDAVKEDNDKISEDGNTYEGSGSGDTLKEDDKISKDENTVEGSGGVVAVKKDDSKIGTDGNPVVSSGSFDAVKEDDKFSKDGNIFSDSDDVDRDKLLKNACEENDLTLEKKDDKESQPAKTSYSRCLSDSSDGAVLMDDYDLDDIIEGLDLDGGDNDDGNGETSLSLNDKDDLNRPSLSDGKLLDLGATCQEDCIETTEASTEPSLDIGGSEDKEDCATSWSLSVVNDIFDSNKDFSENAEASHVETSHVDEEKDCIKGKMGKSESHSSLEPEDLEGALDKKMKKKSKNKSKRFKLFKKVFN